MQKFTLEKKNTNRNTQLPWNQLESIGIVADISNSKINYVQIDKIICIEDLL